MCVGKTIPNIFYTPVSCKIHITYYKYKFVYDIFACLSSLLAKCSDPPPLPFTLGGVTFNLVIPVHCQPVDFVW